MNKLNDMSQESFKCMYESLINTLTATEEKDLNSLYASDDYKNRSIYLMKTRKTHWGKMPNFFLQKLSILNINNFKALLILLKQLKEVGLLLSKNPFMNKDIENEYYLITVQRTDKKYIDIYCTDLKEKEHILKQIKDYQASIKFKRLRNKGVE